MSSNKLYTEEQVKEAIKMALHGFGIGGIEDTIEVVASKFTPIQLPSDEEIEKNVICSNLGLGYDFSMNSGFKKGAKWMRNKIQGGNK